MIHPLFNPLTTAAPITEYATPASHNGSQKGTGWVEVKGAEATLWGACPMKGAVTHQTHHTLPKGPQGLQTPGLRVLGKGQAGQTSWQTWKEPLGSRILSSLHSQCPESHPFFLLLKKSTFKPDTLRAEGGSFCTFCPQPW